MGTVMQTLGNVVLCLLSLPLQAGIACAIMLLAGPPVVFRQKRIGKGGKPFTLLKFRTMRVGAYVQQRRLRSLNESAGPTFKIHDDPRFTAIGRFLSHTGLDELPQLWNVLRGEMAIIGPRPLPVSEASRLSVWMRARHDVLPGIVSPAILTGSYHKNFTAWMKSDVAYAKTQSLAGDISLLLRGVLLLVRLLVREIDKMV